MTGKLYLPRLILLIVPLFFFLTGIYPADYEKEGHINDLAQQEADSLTTEKMMEIILIRLPDRAIVDSLDQPILLKILDTLGIRNSRDLLSFFDNYTEDALLSEKRICREMLEKYEQYGTLSSTDSFCTDEDNLENIRKERFFTQAGLIREMLVIKYGEEMDNLIRSSDIEDEYNLEKMIEDEYEGVD